MRNAIAEAKWRTAANVLSLGRKDGGVGSNVTTRRVVAAKMTKNDQPNWAHRNPKLDPTASI